MATEKDAVRLLEKLLEQGCDLYERLHRSSVHRRKPATLAGRQVPPPSDSANPDQMDEWLLDGMVYCDPMVEWQEERDAICFELDHLTRSIDTLLADSLAGWVNALPDRVRSNVFDPGRLILAYSGKERCWDREIKLWERGDWEGLLHHGDIGVDEYLSLTEQYPAGNPKFPAESAEHYRHSERPLGTADQSPAGEGASPPVPGEGANGRPSASTRPPE